MAAFLRFSLFGAPSSLSAEEVFHYFEDGGRPVFRLSGSRPVGLVPFANMTGDADFDWVGEAMTSALVEMLERGGATVRIMEGDELEKERMSRGRKIDLVELEKRKVQGLGIQAIVRCEYRKSARGDFRFSCDLREPGRKGGGYAISECGTMDEIFELQSRLIERVGNALGITLQEGDGPARKVGVKAYEYLQRALSSPAGSYRRLYYCLRALEEDPGYDEARFRLAEAYYLIGISYGNRECLERALSEYRKIAAVNPRYSRAHYRIGMVLFLRGDYEESRRAFERALELSPAMTEARVGLRRLAEAGR